MNTELADFLYVYSLKRKLSDFTYSLCIEEIMLAIVATNAEPELLTEWLNENT